MATVIPDLAKLTRSYSEFRTAADLVAISNEVSYDCARAQIAAILDGARDTPARKDVTEALADFLLDLLTTAALHDCEADHYAITTLSPMMQCVF